MIPESERLPQSNNDDEIDLRPYLIQLVRNWKILLLITLGFALVAAVLSLIQPRSYNATADILLKGSQSTLLLAEQYQTTTGTEDVRTQTDALLSLAQSDNLALDTLELLGNAIPENRRLLDKFKRMVTVSNKGAIILITATADDPGLAARIANTWAEHTVEAINRAYAEGASLQDVESSLPAAEQEYNSAQSALEVFIQYSHISLLTNQIGEAMTSVNSLTSQRTELIAYYTNRIQEMQGLETQAEGLRIQVQSSARSEAGRLGDALAVLTARAQALGIDISSNLNPSTNNDSNFTVQINDWNEIVGNTSNFASDLDSLIQLGKAEKERAESALTVLIQEVTLGQTDPALEELIKHINSLQAQLEQEQARQRELTSQRDLAWQAYQAITQKQAEIKNTPQMTNYSTIASQAISPSTPNTRGTVRNTLIAGVLGLIFGIAGLFSIQWWQLANNRQAEFTDPSTASNSSKP